MLSAPNSINRWSCGVTSEAQSVIQLFPTFPSTDALYHPFSKKANHSRSFSSGLASPSDCRLVKGTRNFLKQDGIARNDGKLLSATRIPYYCRNLVEPLKKKVLSLVHSVQDRWRQRGKKKGRPVLSRRGCPHLGSFFKTILPSESHSLIRFVFTHRIRTGLYKYSVRVFINLSIGFTLSLSSRDKEAYDVICRQLISTGGKPLLRVLTMGLKTIHILPE